MQPSLIYVGNEDYCRACHTAMPIIKAEAHDLGLPVTWYDTDEDMVAIAGLSVESLPTTIMVRGGVEVGRIVGAFPRDSLRAKLTALMAN